VGKTVGVTVVVGATVVVGVTVEGGFVQVTATGVVPVIVVVGVVGIVTSPAGVVIVVVGAVIVTVGIVVVDDGSVVVVTGVVVTGVSVGVTVGAGVSGTIVTTGISVVVTGVSVGGVGRIVVGTSGDGVSTTAVGSPITGGVVVVVALHALPINLSLANLLSLDDLINGTVFVIVVVVFFEGVEAVINVVMVGAPIPTKLAPAVEICVDVAGGKTVRLMLPLFTSRALIFVIDFSFPQPAFMLLIERAIKMRMVILF
jgi:hypothetical protein